MIDTKALFAKITAAINSMQTTSSHDYTITGNVGTVYARRCGNVVSLVVHSTSTKNYTAGYTTMCTLDAEYCPKTTVVATAMDSNTSTVSTVPMGLRIDTDGKVQVYRYSGNGNSTTPRATVSYVV